MHNSKASSDTKRNEDIGPEYVSAFQKLVNEVSRANSVLQSTADFIGRDLGINAARWQFIVQVNLRPQTVAQIARQLGVARQTLHPTANKLRERGLIEYLENPDHARSPLVGLTADGKQMLETLKKRQTEFATTFYSTTRAELGELSDTALTLGRIRQLAEAILESMTDKNRN